MLSKKQLAIILSKLKPFSSPNPQLEQYLTSSDIAADILWNMYMLKDHGTIADLGCGTGILGLGALILNDSKCFSIDCDPKAIEIAKMNKEYLEQEFDTELDCTFISEDISSFNTPVDIVIQNPPFGIQKKHADRLFLEHAMTISPIIYSLHTADSAQFIQAISKETHSITHKWQYEFPLRNTMKHHSKNQHTVKVICVRLAKNDPKHL